MAFCVGSSRSRLGFDQEPLATHFQTLIWHLLVTPALYLCDRFVRQMALFDFLSSNDPAISSTALCYFHFVTFRLSLRISPRTSSPSQIFRMVYHPSD